MTKIDTSKLGEGWNNQGGAAGYLERISFVALTDDMKNVSIITDEEGNNEIILTPEAAEYVRDVIASMLIIIGEKKNETE